MPTVLIIALLLAAVLYLRGWLYLHSVHPDAIPASRAASFLAGLACLWLALASPLSAYDDSLLTIHMLQHLLLMTIAPALLLLAAPMMPLLHGIPGPIMHNVVSPILRWLPLQRAGHTVTQPAFALFAASAAIIVWHIPAIFTAALRCEPIHILEHTTFFTAGLIFWWPVIAPWPSTIPWPRWSLILYLALATVPCDILSGFLVFSERLVYPIYLTYPSLAHSSLATSSLASPSLTPRPFPISPYSDQQLAGALMWTAITILYLVPAAILTIKLLAPRHLSTTTHIPSSHTASQ
jgi:putative membrane protein